MFRFLADRHLITSTKAFVCVRMCQVSKVDKMMAAAGIAGYAARFLYRTNIPHQGSSLYSTPDLSSQSSWHLLFSFLRLTQHSRKTVFASPKGKKHDIHANCYELAFC